MTFTPLTSIQALVADCRLRQFKDVWAETLSPLRLCDGSPGRLPAPIHVPSSSFSIRIVLHRPHQQASFRSGGCGSDSNAGQGGDQSRLPFSRVLLPSLCGPKGGRGLEAHHQFKAPKQGLFGASTFLYGHSAMSRFSSTPEIGRRPST